MKVIALVIAGVFATTSVGGTELGMNPVTRLVELLKGLMATTEAEGKTEEQLFEKYVCWAKSTMAAKTASNSAATSRINELTTYIADIEAGRHEFTTERVDLEKDLAEINKAMEQASAIRKTEHDEFVDAEDEILKGIKALNASITILKDATADHLQGVLLAQRSGTGGFLGVEASFAAHSEKSRALARAADLGDRVLGTGDARFLRRLLTGDVPTWDWKKLNRKATFKMSYKARSLKIQKVLLGLNATFASSLKDALRKEFDAAAEYKKLMAAKGEEKASTEEALAKLEIEHGARSLTKEQAQAQVDALTAQVTNDSRFIEQIRKALQEKTEEWSERSKLRSEELSAMSKAIAILHNDDARDLFKKSFASQGYSLLQTEGRRARQGRDALQAAAAQIRSTAAVVSAHEGRLTALASMVAAGNGTHFTEVISAIDRMITHLKDEEASDLAVKEQCESDRMVDTREAAVVSRTMDEHTEEITKLNAEIEAIIADVKEKEEVVAQTIEQLEQATTQRLAEHKEWQSSDADDKEAVATVLRAKEVLARFYAESNLMLVQQHAEPEDFTGKAPPPPPSTWEAPYGGKTQESTSILAVLDMIVKDIKTDLSDALAAEKKSQKTYDTFKAESDAQVKQLKDSILDLELTKGEKQESVSQLTQERASLKSELDAVMKKMADAKPGCDFITINYTSRLQNRQIEIDGLTKAKAYLTGAVFSHKPDPTRELKPGDALFLQRRLRGTR